MTAETMRDMYPSDTAELMISYLSGIKTYKEVSARASVYADFFAVTGADLLRCQRDTIVMYLNVLGSRVEKEAMKRSTSIKYRKFLSAFLSWCEAEKESGNEDVPDGFRNVMKDIRSEESGEVFRLEEMPGLSELDKLIGYLKEKDRLVLTAAMLSMKCLLKTGEIVPLKRRDILSESGGKTFIIVEGRTVPIFVPEDISGLLDETVGAAGTSQWLFPSRKNGGHLEVSFFQRHLSNACKSAGVRRMTFNSLRNMASVMAVSAGADVVKLNEDLGNKTKTHIAKLESLPLRYSDSGDRYVNLTFKEGRKGETDGERNKKGEQAVQQGNGGEFPKD